MKKIFERTEDVGCGHQFMRESVKEDADYSRYLVETYPDLKALYEMKPGFPTEENLRSPDKENSFSGYQNADSH